MIPRHDKIMIKIRTYVSLPCSNLKDVIKLAMKQMDASAINVINIDMPSPV